MDKHRASVFKALKLLADTFLLAILLAAMSLAAASTPAHAQDFEDEVLSEEDFEDRQAQGWALAPSTWTDNWNPALSFGRCCKALIVWDKWQTGIGAPPINGIYGPLDTWAFFEGISIVNDEVDNYKELSLQRR